MLFKYPNQFPFKSCRPKRQAKPSADNGFWDCSVCTFKNSAEAFNAVYVMCGKVHLQGKVILQLLRGSYAFITIINPMHMHAVKMSTLLFCLVAVDCVFIHTDVI